jgi:hypothetical protein
MLTFWFFFSKFLLQQPRDWKPKVRQTVWHGWMRGQPWSITWIWNTPFFLIGAKIVDEREQRATRPGWELRTDAAALAARALPGLEPRALPPQRRTATREEEPGHWKNGVGDTRARGRDLPSAQILGRCIMNGWSMIFSYICENLKCGLDRVHLDPTRHWIGLPQGGLWISM